MTPEEFADLLEKSAEEIDRLQSENADLRQKLDLQTAYASAGESLDKVAEVTGLERDKVYDALSRLTPEQREIFEKTASEDNSFSLGGLSSLDDSPESADEQLKRFMET